jgi:hypothetical protein
VIHSIAVYVLIVFLASSDCVGDYYLDVFIKRYITIAVIHSIAVYTGFFFWLAAVVWMIIN